VPDYPHPRAAQTSPAARQPRQGRDRPGWSGAIAWSHACHLPEEGGGRLIFAAASPAAGPDLHRPRVSRQEQRPWTDGPSRPGPNWPCATCRPHLCWFGWPASTPSGPASEDGPP